VMIWQGSRGLFRLWTQQRATSKNTPPNPPPSAHLVQHQQARAAALRRPRLVEADVARAADAEDLDVEPAGRRDARLVVAAVLGDALFFPRKVG
jgi:hypothetical protein